MVKLACVLLQVSARDVDPFDRCPLWLDLDPAFVGQRVLVLADLVVLGQVGVPVALSLPKGVFGDFTIQRQTGFDREKGGSIETLTCPDVRTPGRSATPV